MSDVHQLVTKEWVLEQIAAGVKPLDGRIATLLTNGAEQKEWMTKLWEYLTKARGEDDVRYSKLYVTKNELELEKARKEGYAVGIAEKVAQEDKKQTRVDTRLLILATAAAGVIVWLFDHVKFN